MLKAKERQAIFEEAFVTEIQQYKQSGIIPSKNTKVVFCKYIRRSNFFLPIGLSLANRTTASLEEIVVEDDPSSLNEFLHDVDANETNAQ